MSQNKITNPQIVFISFLLIITSIFILRIRSSVTASDSLSNTAVSAAPELLLDINTTPTGSNPQSAVTIGSQFLFFANDNIHGNELWVSDGSVAGTNFLYDLHPGSEGVEPKHLTVLNETLYFVIDDGTTIGLWRSDGTEVGTFLVSPFPFLSYEWGNYARGVREIVTHNNMLYFSISYYSEAGEENVGLWESDGTTNGTNLIKSFPRAQQPKYLTSMNGLLYFYAEDDQQNKGIWQSDGTSVGTIFIDGFEYINEMTTSNNLLYVIGAKNNIDGLWKSDGSPNNATILSTSTYPVDLYAWNNIVLFSSLIGPGNQRGTLWKSDGTVEGTIELKDASLSPDLNFGVAHDGNLYFMAGNGLATGLWKTDGSILGTIPVKSDLVDSSFGPWQFGQILAFSNSLFFSGPLTESTYGIWESDGSTSGTTLLASFNSFPLVLANQAGNTFFAAEDNIYGRELWNTDGTTVGTVFFKEINYGTDSSNPDYLTNFRGQLLFHSDKTDVEYSGDPDGIVWLSDGTITNTVPLTLTIQFDQYGQPGFQLIDNRFIYADVAALWSSDGITTSFTTDFKIYNVDEYLESKGMMFLIADFGGRLPAYSLWRIDSTLEDIELLRDYGYTGTGGTGIRSLTSLNGSLYYLEYGYPIDRLWRSDGTISGTSVVVSFSEGYFPVEAPIMAYNNVLYFLLEDDENSQIKLWQSDGTESGTMFMLTLMENCSFVSSLDFKQVNNRLFFHLNGCGTHQLWTSLGSSNNTTLLSTFNNIAGLQRGGTGLFFNADDGVNGEELWFTNGTVTGTRLIKDINPGPSSSSPSSMFFFPGTGYLYFAADDGVNGSELWQSDGSNANTALLADINPGVGDSTPASFVYIRPNLYFSANHADFGREVWKMFLPANEELFMPLVFEK